MKTILITGASRGIGRAAAIQCGTLGWRVVVNFANNHAAAEDTVAAVIAAGGEAIPAQGDVTIEGDVARIFDAAHAAFGPLDGVVNNAGIVAPKSSIADMSAERMRAVFDTNILGSFFVAREASRRMSTTRGGNGGSLVNVSSAAARLGSPGEYVDYAASKGAMDTMTVGLAKELAPEGIRVNAVRPGFIDTDIHASGGQPDRAARLGKTTPLGRAGTAEEVAETIIWLLSDASSYVTSALIDVSGGR